MMMMNKEVAADHFLAFMIQLHLMTMVMLSPSFHEILLKLSTTMRWTGRRQSKATVKMKRIDLEIIKAPEY